MKSKLGLILLKLLFFLPIQGLSQDKLAFFSPGCLLGKERCRKNVGAILGGDLQN